MKKRIIAALLAVLLLMSLSFLSSCNKKYELRFDYDGTAYETIMVTSNEEIVLPENPEKEGYSFLGWYWDVGEWQEKLAEDSLIKKPIKRDRSVYANWQKNVYTISFFTNSVDFIAPIEYEYQDLIEQVADPIKDGHEFMGWYYDDKTFEQPFFYTSMPAQNIVLYAKWQEIT